MDKKTLKELVKTYFNLEDIKTEDTTHKTEQKFAVAHLIDGTQVTNDKDSEFAEGDALFVITEDGEKVQAPSGEHELESGIVVTVSEEGVITGIKRPGEEGEGSLEASAQTKLAEEEIVEEMEDEESDIKEAIIEAIMEEVAPRMQEMEQKMSECMTKLADYEEKMKEYMAEPAQAPTSEKKFSKVKPNIAVYNTKRYEAALNKLKSN